MDKRRDYDWYPTPYWCIHRLLERFKLPGGLWLEPCAGDGAIIKAVSEVRDDFRWNAVEIQAVAAPLLRPLCPSVVITDFLTWQHPTPLPVGVLTNPPYTLSLQFVEHCLSMVRRYVIMLMPLTFLASKDRNDFLQANPPSVFPLPNRPSFTHKGSGMTEYGFFAWDKQRIAKKKHYGLVIPLAKTSKAEIAYYKKRQYGAHQPPLLPSGIFGEKT